MKKMDTFVLGMVQVNTYLLWEENHVLIVDPGSKSHKLQETIDSQKATIDTQKEELEAARRRLREMAEKLEQLEQNQK